MSRSTAQLCNSCEALSRSHPGLFPPHSSPAVSENGLKPLESLPQPGHSCIFQPKPKSMPVCILGVSYVFSVLKIPEFFYVSANSLWGPGD